MAFKKVLKFTLSCFLEYIKVRMLLLKFKGENNMSEQSNYHIVEGGGKPQFRIVKPLCSVLCVFFTLSFFTVPVFAQDAETPPSKTEIIQNDEAGTVSIVIDGKTVGFFTKDGFHVLGDIVYSGTIRDAGGDVQKIIEEHNSDGGADEEKQ